MDQARDHRCYEDDSPSLPRKQATTNQYVVEGGGGGWWTTDELSGIPFAYLVLYGPLK